jgi:serine/threonine protein kinase
MPSQKVVLLQLANGLEFIHSRQLLHCDIRPGNVLIFTSFNNGPAFVKWSGFGLFKSASPNDQNRLPEVTGDVLWLAPELLKVILETSSHSATRQGVETDIFAAGCTLFFYLTDGVHPFGNGAQQIVANMENAKVVNACSKDYCYKNLCLFHHLSYFIFLELPPDHFAHSVVTKIMMAEKPENRINWVNGIKNCIFNQRKPNKVLLYYHFQVFFSNLSIFFIEGTAVAPVGLQFLGK